MKSIWHWRKHWKTKQAFPDRLEVMGELE
jgi:hypothetical protein